jgi:hypothetical protein
MNSHKSVSGPGKNSIFGQTLQRLSGSIRPDTVPPDNRKHRRLPAHGLIQLMWRDESDEEQQSRVDALDACPFGLAFRSQSAVPVGRTVILSDGQAILCGQVRRCTPDSGEFAIGIEVQQLEGCAESSLFPEEQTRAAASLADMVRPTHGDV